MTCNKTGDVMAAPIDYVNSLCLRQGCFGDKQEAKTKLLFAYFHLYAASILCNSIRRSHERSLRSSLGQRLGFGIDAPHDQLSN